MEEQFDKSKTIIHKIKQLLLNCDLTLAFAQGEIEINRATMELYKGARKHWKKMKFLEAKIDKERYEIFVQDIIKVKENLTSNVNSIIGKYSLLYQRVFDMFYMRDISIEDIAVAVNLKTDIVENIIKKFNTDLIECYC